MFLLRLDDMAPNRDVEKWERMRALLNKYRIKPIFGIIPDNQDPQLLKYPADENFWGTVQEWIEMGWTPALHGYRHVFDSTSGGVNPVNAYSEFAGVPYETQALRIEEGYEILKERGIKTEIFFAPAHTYDENTVKALKEYTDIRVISDTVANKVYYKDGMYYIPQQSGAVRKLPFKLVTFCYHPNIMKEEDFVRLENFLEENHARFGHYGKELLTKRRRSLYDCVLQWIYLFRHKKK